MICRLTVTLVATLLLPALAACTDIQTGETSGQKAVLITGASTGLGRAMAERMAENGYYVYAGARKQKDLDALNAIENIQAIRIDVTVQEEVDAAAEIVRAEGRGLYALINNAGVLITGPTTETDIDDVKWLFDVNVYGVMRTSSAFTPLLMESQGRIINIGSIAGSVGFGYLGPYTMSKHAMEAYTESLHAELAPLGVSVSVVKPGDYASDIWKPDAQLARLEEMKTAGSPFVSGYKGWLDFSLTVEQGDPFDVADVTLQALSDVPMARRYLIVPNEKEMAWVMNNMVDRLADLNRNNEFSWTPEKIAEDVGAAIAQKESEQE
jgi:NAD(P)-dependent dehydrogenase (short-subunit alcohol dehydrogenase family)